MHNLKRYALMLEQAIGRAFAADKLPIHIVRTLQGPHTLTTALRLYQPTKTNMAKAEKLGPSIEAHTGVGPVRIFTQSGVVYVETPSPVGVPVPGTRLAGQGLAVPIGMTSLRTIAGWDAEREPHLLLVGPTGKGKTTAARLVAFHLARQNPSRRLRFVVSTFKPKDWTAFQTLAHTLGVLTDVDETVSMIDWLTETMYRRTANQIDTPHLVVFLDDLLNLLSKADVTGQLADIASLGRGAGIHLVIGTQRTGKRGAGDAAVTGNITARLVFSTASAQDAAQFSGRGGTGAETLGRYPGDALLITDADGVQRVAVGHIADQDLSTLPQRQSTPWGEHRPWQNRAQGAPDTSIEQAEQPQNARNGRPPTSIPVQRTVTLPLPYRKPTAAERAVLRRLYKEKGSKNKALAAAYEYGKTPKSLSWLNEALQEVQP